MTRPSAAHAEGTAAPAKGPGAAVLVLYNLVFWPYLLVTCAISFWPALAIFLATFAFDRKLRVLHQYTSRWAGHYLEYAPYAGVTVEGREHVQKDRAYVFVSNHQSMVDILAAFATRLDYKWVSKIENFYAPFIGWAMVLNRYVALRRGHLPSILRMFRRCERVLSGGESVFIFPEGTRSPDGSLQRFYRGAFLLSVRRRVPVVPIVFDGTGAILKKGTARVTPRPVRVRILPPVDPAIVDGDDRKLRDLVHDQMRTELAKLQGGA